MIGSPTTFTTSGQRSHHFGPSSQINPTMTGEGRLVLVWGQTCRALLVDKGKTISHRR